MEITYEQFARGIAAIQAYRDLLARVSQAYQDAGEQRVDSLGGDGAVSELTRQLEERCGDPNERYGSMITYMLYDCGGPVAEVDGTSRMVNTPELLWRYWQETARGPFAPPTTTGEEG